jgi:hypothetical protein
MQDLLPAGGLRLFREGVEPSGSLQKVSGYISILLLRPLPDANSIRLQEGSYCAIMGCGGREVVYYSGFHQYLLCWWWV